MTDAGRRPVTAQDLTRLRGVSDPQISPDGRRVAFVMTTASEEREEDRGKSRPAHVISALKYRFEGIGFTYDRRPHIFVVRVTGGAPTQITDGDFPDVWPTWASDGGRIAFVAERHDTRDTDVHDAIYDVASDGGEPRRISRTLMPIDRKSTR